MNLRSLVRGRVDWNRIERVAAEIVERYDRGSARVEFPDADNWLSTPMVVDEDLFVKIVTKQNTAVHAVFTTGRNLGAFTAGTETFFETYETPYEMAKHELEATRRIRELGINAPEPIEAFEMNGLGITVLEYLPEFEPLDEVDRRRATELAPDIFQGLRTMHDNGLAHGDLRAENVLILDDELYFIDATNVDEDAHFSARAYDVASALAALEPLIGPEAAVDAAFQWYSHPEVMDAQRFFDFVSVRPDHDFDVVGLCQEIEELDGHQTPRDTRPFGATVDVTESERSW